MAPEAEYEIKGFYGNVIFACGATTDDRGSITLYYGAGDECTAAAATTVEEVMATLEYSTA